MTLRLNSGVLLDAGVHNERVCLVAEDDQQPQGKALDLRRLSQLTSLHRGLATDGPNGPEEEARVSSSRETKEGRDSGSAPSEVPNCDREIRKGRFWHAR